MPIKKLIQFFLPSLFLVAIPGFTNELNFTGFITVAGGTTLDKDSSYRVEPSTGGAYDDNFRFDPESVAGLQVQAVITDRLRGTLQVVGKGCKGFETDLEWAYITYDLTPTLALNAGRYRLPTFYYSESLDVGYAYHWIRPPTEVYSIFTAALEGFNFVHNTFAGDIEINTQVWYGAIDATIPDGTYYDTLNNTGINVLFSYDWAKVRLLYNTLDIATRFPADNPDDVIETKSDVTFMAIAFMADFDNIIWRSEYTHSRSQNDFSIDAWYGSAGYKIGKFIPHYTHAEEDSDLTLSKTKTDTLGVAWYFHPSAVAKFEYVNSETESSVTQAQTDAEVLAVALDIVF